ncbi:hypothetical protein ACFOGG_01310 [Brenneria rubrifaciens]|uniref:hypothetical protein n=1 Tax=Brenneria rubrifaciens TaxID=55213 RepID=UPI0036216A7F
MSFGITPRSMKHCSSSTGAAEHTLSFVGNIPSLLRIRQPEAFATHRLCLSR